MKKVINNVEFEFDESLTYLDFYLSNKKPNLVELDIIKLVNHFSNFITENDKEYLLYLSRWVIEAPRKRMYRNMKLEGHSIISSEYFFEIENGDQIIDQLENTGKLAASILKCYGFNSAAPLKNIDPFTPTTEKILEDERSSL